MPRSELHSTLFGHAQILAIAIPSLAIGLLLGRFGLPGDETADIKRENADLKRQYEYMQHQMQQLKLERELPAGEVADI